MVLIKALNNNFANYYSLYRYMIEEKINECNAEMYYIGDSLGSIHLTIELLKEELEKGNLK